jgi:hypothetical protein
MQYYAKYHENVQNSHFSTTLVRRLNIWQLIQFLEFNLYFTTPNTSLAPVFEFIFHRITQDFSVFNYQKLSI